MNKTIFLHNKNGHFAKQERGFCDDSGLRMHATIKEVCTFFFSHATIKGVHPPLSI